MSFIVDFPASAVDSRRSPALPHTEPAIPAQRQPAPRVAGKLEPVAPARVTVAWTTSNDDGVPRPTRTEIELVAGFDATGGTWTCRESVGSNWVEALSSARSNEVVLTARIGSDVSAKHRVLELAELLTFRLSASQPLIRVRFLPSAPGPLRVRSHA
jgi:hypothetical protein